MQGWVAGYLTSLAPHPVRWDDKDKFASIERRHILYAELERHEAWLDFVHRMSQVKEGLERDLLIGTLDANGHGHDDEKRAALNVVNVMLAYVPAIHRDFDDMRRNVERWKSLQQKDSTRGV